ncbi:MAG: UDP-N-acetylmuramoyl-L-alanyl-D-glutamate--2,6-diaminopimelate ligase [Anaerolineaceae bacterium]|nr:UDP-N-acetylmuramoyl-L-alanyl-D-glutamate--2,6-diaminopimelate ligase [Anaerolineaceae bacterium]
MTGQNIRSLSDLLGNFHFLSPLPGRLPDVDITGIAYDSRQVQPGNIFVAIKGESSDGHQYIQSAVSYGAAAIIGTEAPPAGLEALYFQVENSRKALAEISAAFFDFPARHLTVIGVTGTDGKTTTASLIYSILRAADIPAGMISTVGAKIGEEELDTGFHVTTPEAPDVQHYLARMRDAGVTHVVLESTSHGLAQYRVWACEFDVGVVTNITHEHLDYHGSYAAYRDAKGMLFRLLADTRPKEGGIPPLAVLNKDDGAYAYLHDISTVPQTTYSLEAGADLRAEQITQTGGGVSFIVTGSGFRQRVESRLTGIFNVSNCLAAFSTAVYGLQIEPSIAAKGISLLDFVPGRMERVEMGQDFLCVVDFAHTPNALQAALRTARQMTAGRVITVFGSAGLRDRAKRRMMAEVATELADLTILTAEDPRSESLEDILAEMSEAARSKGGVEGCTYWRVPDRGEAIRLALSLAHKGDIVIACGKGHEQSMCFGVIEYPWDDRTAMRAALAESLHVEGPPMPYLPTQEP